MRVQPESSFDIQLGEKRRHPFAHLDPHAISAAIGASAVYLFGAAPLLLAAIAQTSVTGAQAQSWFFIVFLTAALSTIALSFRFRQPIPIGWSMPGVLFLLAASTSHSFSEIVGASFLAGIAIAALGATGLARYLTRLVPYPIVLGTVAGSFLATAWHGIVQIDGTPLVAGSVLLGYLALVRMAPSTWPAPAGGALGGLAALALTGQLSGISIHPASPQLAIAIPRFDTWGALELAIPLVILSLCAGTAQGIGMLESEGFSPPVRSMTITIGVASMVNSFFGGHISSTQTQGVALLAGPDAGAREKRYLGAVLAAIVAVGIALSAGFVGGIFLELPPAFPIALAGVSVLRILPSSIRQIQGSGLRLGGQVAMVCAAANYQIFGFSGVLVGLVAGILVSWNLERTELRAFWSASGLSVPRLRMRAQFLDSRMRIQPGSPISTSRAEPNCAE